MSKGKQNKNQSSECHKKTMLFTLAFVSLTPQDKSKEWSTKGQLQLQLITQKESWTSYQLTQSHGLMVLQTGQKKPECTTSKPREVTRHLVIKGNQSRPFLSQKTSTLPDLSPHQKCISIQRMALQVKSVKFVTKPTMES